MLLCAAVCLSAVCAASGMPAVLQAADPARCATAIRQWVGEYEQRRIGPRGLLRGDRQQPRYAEAAIQGGFLQPWEFERLTHFEVLQKLCAFAARQPSVALADAVLEVAAAGLDRPFLDTDAAAVRDLGHHALAGASHAGIWLLLLRAAAGEPPRAIDGLLPAAPVARPPSTARRVAALRLLGERYQPAHRSTIEAALGDADPRVRLAAAEALRAPWRSDAVRAVAQALDGERHPVVALALVRQVAAMLRETPEQLGDDRRAALAQGALDRLGQCGWRTDLELLEIAAAQPQAALVPRLIDLLDLQIRSPDALVGAINRGASPLLRERAAELLRAMTGAYFAADDPAGWRRFWLAEQHRIKVPAPLPQPPPGATRASFYGLPVTGGSVAFLIDTSGSMAEAPAGTPPAGRRRRESWTRLDVAKEQLLLAVQAMPRGATFQVLAFADRGRALTAAPLPADGRSLRALTGLLGRLEPGGGTNLGDGLLLALEAGERSAAGLETPQIDELFVLSDGEPTAGALRYPSALLAAVRAANQYGRVRIHTVFVGGSGGELLEQLAREHGGVFVRR